MDSRVVHSRTDEFDERPHHNVGTNQENHHHDNEKKSVLKKVKAKAKKIKDTVTKHGHHDHDHEHQYHYEDQHIPDDHDLDQEDDEDEEIDEEPEVHGAPIYDSVAAKSAIPGEVGNSGQSMVHSGGTTLTGEEPHHEPRIVVVSPTAESGQTRATDPARTLVGNGEKPGQPKVNLERPMGLEEDPHAPTSRPEAYTPSNYQTKVTNPTGAGTKEIDIPPIENSFASMKVHEEPKLNPEPKTLPYTAQTQYPSVGSHEQFLPEQFTAIGTHYPYARSHDQSFPHSTATKTQYPYFGSYEQFAPEPVASAATKTQYPSAVGSHDQFAGETIPTNIPENLQAMGQTFNTTTRVGEESHYESPEKSSNQAMDQAFNTTTRAGEQSHHEASGNPSDQSSYTEKISSATSAIADKAAYAKDAVASKLGFGEKSDRDENHIRHEEHSIGQTPLNQSCDAMGNTLNTMPRAGEQPPCESTVKPSYQTSYTGKISSATSAIADKAASAKDAVASKLGYGEKDDMHKNQMRHEEHSTGQTPSNQSSYTGKISSATSAIADKAITAKNVVASKLGYGENGDKDEMERTHEEHNKSGDATTMTGSSAEYGKNIAASTTEQSAPVHGKVAGVGSAVKSKTPGTGSRTGASTVTTNETEGGVPIQDKGVSVKDYLAEKLRPGDEDKALSEVISGALYKGNEDSTEVPGNEDRSVTEVVKDAIHKREEEPERVEHKRLGKVTESEEVKRRLGTGDEKIEKEMEEKSNVNSPGKGMVDKLKGMVGSWFGKPGENQSLQVEGDEGLAKDSGVK